jgi:hypothetical protein
MPKIKDISDRLVKDPGEYSALSFLVAERSFLIVTSLYFFTLLATVGGFYLSWISTATISMISYHLYSLMLIMMVWFGFAWSEHVVYIHAPGKRWISFAVLSVLAVMALV